VKTDALFLSVVHSLRDSDSNTQKYVAWLGVELGVTALADWYGIVPKLVCSYPQGEAIMKKYGLSMLTMLEVRNCSAFMLFFAI
jgi:hypothetical protein